jgi:hypothetical protein
MIIMRGLLKKGITFQWLREHQAEFEVVKECLTDSRLLCLFDLTLDPFIKMNFSHLHGMGYILVQLQKIGTRWESCVMTPTQSLYVIVEMEALAVHYEMKFFPTFQIVVNHHHLVGVFFKPVAKVENKRL